MSFTSICIRFFTYFAYHIHTLFYPRIRAQRKFAQGQGVFPSGGVSTTSSPLKKSNGGVSGQQSSGSSTASGPTTKKSKISSSSLLKQKGECPKTEDFLTFLCLRGNTIFFHFYSKNKLTQLSF